MYRSGEKQTKKQWNMTLQLKKKIKVDHRAEYKSQNFRILVRIPIRKSMWPCIWW